MEQLDTEKTVKRLNSILEQELAGVVRYTHYALMVNNGKHYYRFEGRAIWLPKTEAERPNREFLEWHGDSVFRG